MLLLHYYVLSRLEWLLNSWRSYVAIGLSCLTWLYWQGYCPIDRIDFHAIQFRTGREMDIAIDGRGFLITSNPVTGEQRYFRSGRLRINECGQLVIKHQSQDMIIQPAINIGGDYHKVIIVTDGMVLYTIQGSSGPPANAGHIQVATLLGSDDPAQNLESGEKSQSVPCWSYPGERGAGTIRTGRLELNLMDWLPDVQRGR